MTATTVPQTPFAKAAQTGVPVEITSARTEYNTSFANPEGTTMVQMSVVPVRVRRGTEWTPVDPTLVTRADGMIAPKASTIDVAFSGGGSGPLVTYRRGSEVLHIDAPMPLTVPVLSGASATYPEVLTGVDLRVTATAESFSEVFVVKNATAAANPALESLRFGLVDQGLDVVTTADGGVQVNDAAGNSVLDSVQPTMWDSGSMKATEGVEAGEQPSPEGPGAGDLQAPIKVSASASALTLTPDTTLLTGSQTTFPVYIDPSLGRNRSAWAMVDKSHPSQSFYKWSNGDNGEGMGYYKASGESAITKRLFFRFNTAFLRVTGRRVNSATLRVHEVWAYSCTTSGIEAWLTGGFNSGTDWNSQPTWTGPSTERNVATSGRAECQPSGSEIDFNTKAQVVKSVANNAASTTLGLRASSESSNSGWRRFKNNATLELEYDTRPNIPSKVQMTSPSTKCGGVVPGGDMPMVQATVRDADGEKDQIRAQFQLFKSGDATAIWDYNSPWGPSGAKYKRTVPQLADGTYRWRVRAQDGELSSNWAADCKFTVDGTAPGPPAVTYVSGTFAVGEKVKFRLSGGGSGVAYYKWAVNTDSPSSDSVTPDSGGIATVPVTTFGPFILRAWAYDLAGNRGPAGSDDDDFLATGGDALDWWRLDEASGSSSVNQRRTANPLTLTAGLGRVPGFPSLTGNAVQLAGAATGAGLGAVGPANGQNFSVGAWGNLNATDGRQVLLSQDVAANAGFTLAVETVAGPLNEDDVPGPVLPRFTATLHTSTGGTAIKVVSSRPVDEEEWVHAMVTVQTLESGDVEMALYTMVEGDPGETEDTVESTASTPDFVTSTAASSSVRVGAERKKSALTGYWNGAVDEVVTAQGIFDEAQRTQWRFPADVVAP